jgi:hypothetical protein
MKRFRFATWIVGSLIWFGGIRYYNTVERPDLEMPAAMAQFENSDEAAKKLRQHTAIQNEGVGLAHMVWVGFTAICLYGPLTRAWTKYVVDSK